METIPGALARASLDARERLSVFSRGAAAANGAPDNPAAAGAMAAAARESIFADALLAAMHARLEELKNVAK